MRQIFRNMASLLSCAHFVVLFVYFGFIHAVYIRADGDQPPLRIFHHSCALKKDEGPCKAVHDRFYFDTDTRSCERFEYGGCQGNENNFETLEECEDMCLVKASKSPCHLMDEPGPCRGLVPRYFFDSSVNECRRFFYGGCFGNANNFQTLKQCQDRCQPGIDREEPQDFLKSEKEAAKPTGSALIKMVTSNETSVHTQPQVESKPSSGTEFIPPNFCTSPVNKGHCNGAEKRFFYDPTTKRCQPFSYSGCGGNKNNFVMKRRCMKICMKDHRRNGQIRIKVKNSNILSRSI